MEVKVKFNDINVKEEKEKTLVKILMLKGEKGEKGDGDFNVIETVKVNGTALPVSDKSVNVEIPTNISSFNNDSGYLVENDLQMVETVDVQNGSQITDGTGYARLNKIYGDTEQNGTPTPDTPVDIEVVTGDIDITISNSDNTSLQNFTLSLGNIELFNKDYIFEENGKWYLSKKTRHLSFPISQMNNGENYPGWKNIAQINADFPSKNARLSTLTDYMCNLFKEANNAISVNTNNNNGQLFIASNSVKQITQSQWKEQYSNLIFELVYELESSEVSEINDKILIGQLEQIKNFLIYKNVTNFTISSDGLIPKLNITYGTTNYNIYSKEETDDKIEEVKKEIVKTNEKINENLKFHSVANSSATYIVEFPNGKNMIVDTGQTSQWNDVKNAIDNLGITKFDYMILTHFHGDHIGNVQNLCNNYDLSECICWVQMKPDFTNHSEEIEESEAGYNTVINNLISYGLTPIVPENDSYFIIDENTKLHFLNTSTELAEENNYYSQQAEWHDTGKVNYNMFSLVTEVIYKANVITLTGDIEAATEKAICTYMRKADIMSAPHHGVNREAFLPFYEATKPDIAIMQYVVTASGDGWLQPYFKSFRYFQRVNSILVTSAWSTSKNGMFSYSLDGDSVKTDVTGLGVPNNKITKFGEITYRVQDFVNYIENQTPSTISLSQMINNMDNESILSMYWHTEDTNYFPQLYSDIQNIYPDFGSNSVLYLERSGGSGSALMRLIKSGVEVRARYFGETKGWLDIFGNGVIPNTTHGTDDLITELKKLPIGHYQCKFFQDTNDTVLGNAAYVLDINLISNDGTDVLASIIATNRNTNPQRPIVSCIGYINTTSTPQYNWKKMSFEQTQASE